MLERKTFLIIGILFLATLSLALTPYVNPDLPKTDFNRGLYQNPGQQGQGTSPNSYTNNPQPSAISSINWVLPTQNNINIVGDSNIKVTNDPKNSRITISSTDGSGSGSSDVNGQDIAPNLLCLTGDCRSVWPSSNFPPDFNNIYAKIVDVNGNFLRTADGNLLYVRLVDSNNTGRLSAGVIANPPWLTTASTCDNNAACHITGAIASSKDGNQTWIQIVDSNKAGRLNYGVLANPPFIPTLPDLNAVYVRQTDGNTWYAIKGVTILSQLIESADFNSLYLNVPVSFTDTTLDTNASASASYNLKSQNISGIYDFNNSLKSQDLNVYRDANFYRTVNFFVALADGNIASASVWNAKLSSGSSITLLSFGSDFNSLYGRLGVSSLSQFVETADFNSLYLANALPDLNHVYVRQSDGNVWYALIGSTSLSKLVETADFNSLYLNVADVNYDVNGKDISPSDVNVQGLLSAKQGYISNDGLDTGASPIFAVNKVKGEGVIQEWDVNGIDVATISGKGSFDANNYYGQGDQLTLLNWNAIFNVPPSIAYVPIADANLKTDLNSVFLKQLDANAVFLKTSDGNLMYYTQKDANAVLRKVSDSNNISSTSSTAIRDWNTIASLQAKSIQDWNKVGSLSLSSFGDWNTISSTKESTLADANNIAWLQSKTIQDWNKIASLLGVSIKDWNTIASSKESTLQDANNVAWLRSQAIWDWNTASSLSATSISGGVLQNSDANLYYARTNANNTFTIGDDTFNNDLNVQGKIRTGSATLSGLSAGDINVGNNSYAKVFFANNGFRAPTANGAIANGASCLGTTCSTNTTLALGSGGNGFTALSIANSGGTAINVSSGGTTLQNVISTSESTSALEVLGDVNSTGKIYTGNATLSGLSNGDINVGSKLYVPSTQAGAGASGIGVESGVGLEFGTNFPQLGGNISSAPGMAIRMLDVRSPGSLGQAQSGLGCFSILGNRGGDPQRTLFSICPTTAVTNFGDTLLAPVVGSVTIGATATPTGDSNGDLNVGNNIRVVGGGGIYVTHCNDRSGSTSLTCNGAMAGSFIAVVPNGAGAVNIHIADNTLTSSSNVTTDWNATPVSQASCAKNLGGSVNPRAGGFDVNIGSTNGANGCQKQDFLVQWMAYK